MKLGFMTIAKVYRKKDVQEITDRVTGRVTGEYYPVIILDDGEDTLDATVPKDVYNGIEEDKIYLFAGTYDDRFKRENTTPKPRITAVLYLINEPWRKDFIDEFSKQHTTALQCRSKMSSRKTPLLQLLRLLSNYVVISRSLPALL